MTRKVETVTADDDLEQAARRGDHEVGAARVGRRRAVGIITDRDITVRATADGRSPRQVKVRAVMTPVPVCGYEDQDAPAARLMEDNQVRRLPVLGRDGRLVGSFPWPTWPCVFLIRCCCGSAAPCLDGCQSEAYPTAEAR
jgi:CBS domain-containing protein